MVKNKVIFSLDLNHLLSLPYHVCWKNKDFIYMGYNDYGAKALGFHNGTEICGISDFEIYSYQSACIIRDHDMAVIDSKTQLLVSTQRVVQSQSITWIFFSRIIPLFAENHSMAGILELSTVRRSSVCTALNPNCENCPSLVRYDSLLSKREHDCLQFLSCGLSVKQIAKQINVSPRTVETYIERSKIKLNSNTKSELILAFLNKSLE